MKIIKILLLFFIVITLLITTSIIRYERFISNTQVYGEFTLEPGLSFKNVYNKVVPMQDTPAGLYYYLRITFKLFHYGYYTANGISLKELLTNISQGKQSLMKVTIPEGFNMYEIASILDSMGVASKDDLLKSFHRSTLIKQLTGGNYRSLEGFLAPGTYMFEKNYPSDKVASTMVKEFFRILPDNFTYKAGRLGLSFYDALILASIVQKETYGEEEAPVVASVFLNRIKKKMLIQADPTIIYGIYNEFNGKIKKSDLRNANNIYNTYRHKGLPPTPISNPSKISLLAVIEPKNSNYLYFVATKEGNHVFSSNYEEHRKNVRIHQLGESQ